jgi:hypothetical protein
MFIKILKHAFAFHFCRHSRFFFLQSILSHKYTSRYTNKVASHEKIFRLIQNVTQEYSSKDVGILVKDISQE